MTRKFTLKQTVVALSILLLVVASSCKKKDPEPDARTQQLQNLSATWKVKTVDNDGTDVTGQYTGFTLTVNQLNYTTQNGGNPWPVTGTYDFKGDDLKTLVRSDNTEISIDELTDTSLVLSFNYSTVNGGRVRGITGDFTFSLTK